MSQVIAIRSDAYQAWQAYAPVKRFTNNGGIKLLFAIGAIGLVAGALAAAHVFPATNLQTGLIFGLSGVSMLPLIIGKLLEKQRERQIPEDQRDLVKEAFKSQLEEQA